MRTAVFEASASIGARIEELLVLQRTAEKLKDSDEAAYNALCRSCSVLLASHIEGFVKDLVNSVRTDLNFYLADFSKMPTALKRRFCEKIAFYEGVPQSEIDRRVRQLIDFFDKNHVPIDLSLVSYRETENNNPKPAAVEKYFTDFGVNGALTAVSAPYFTAVFSGSKHALVRLRRDMRRFRSLLYFFPYKPLDPKMFSEVKKDGSRRDKNEETLWHTFLQEVITRRHQIAHGDTLDNVTSSESLLSDIWKAEILMYALMYFFCGRLGASY